MDLAQHLEDPEQLERLYRASPQSFARALAELDAAHDGHPLVRAWRARLAPEAVADGTQSEVSWGRVSLLAIAAAGVARLGFLDGKEPGFERLGRLGGFICVVPVALVLWRRRELQARDMIRAGIALAALAGACFTPIEHSQSGILSLAHSPPLLVVLVFAAIARDLVAQRAEFIALAAEIAIFSLALLFGGVVLTALTIGVFRLIKIDIGDFYFKNIVVAGIAAAPIVAAGLERARAQRVERLGPALARIFAPLALATLLAYALAILGTGSNPYQKRESLAVLYAMLLATALLVTLMLLQNGERRPSRAVLLLACAIAGLSIAVDGIALSAIIYRFASFGMSPNRVAVLGGNLLLFGYLCGLALALARAARSGGDAELPLRWIAAYIPFFGVWSALWVFVLPALFRFA